MLQQEEGKVCGCFYVQAARLQRSHKERAINEVSHSMQFPVEMPRLATRSPLS